MQNEPQILFTEIPAAQGNIGVITLNRPRALNALSPEMIIAMKDQLQNWAIDPNINIVFIQSSAERSFCAGGDLKEVYKYGRTNYIQGMHFYTTEYELNLLIHEFPKPYIALLNGIAMGGGLGISMHSARVLATETLQLAMPETGIGFFPDVGAGFFLKDCPHKIGMYLGLTGSAIGIADATYAKLVDAFVPSKSMAKIIPELSTQDLTKDPLTKLDAIINKYQQEAEHSTLQQNSAVIEKCFGAESIEGILTALNAENTAWTKQQIQILNSRSPTSLKIAFKVFTMESGMSLKQALSMELRLTTKMMQEHDIYEGIRAVLIDKTRDPKWQPANLKDVQESELNKLFQ